MSTAPLTKVSRGVCRLLLTAVACLAPGKVLGLTEQEPPHASAADTASLPAKADEIPSSESPAPIPEATVDTFPSAWHPGDPVRVANPGAIVDSPAVSGMRSSTILRSAELQLSLGTTLLTCPQPSDACQSSPGAAVALGAFHKPVAWFSWGLELDGAQSTRTWNLSEGPWLLKQRSISARLMGRVHVTGLEAVDPYLGLGLGAGAFETNVQGPETFEQTEWVGSPLYGARAGVTIEVTERWNLGAAIDWASIQANTGQTCPWVVGGVCSSNNWHAFSPSNAVWRLAGTLSFAFGEEL